MSQPQKTGIQLPDPKSKDPKDWARKLLWRHENGDPRPHACVVMAKRALGLLGPEDRGNKR